MIATHGCTHEEGFHEKKILKHFHACKQVYRTMTSGRQGAPYFRRCGRELVSETGDFVNPFRAPEPLPILNASNFVPKNGFPVVKGLMESWGGYRRTTPSFYGFGSTMSPVIQKTFTSKIALLPPPVL